MEDKIRKYIWVVFCSLIAICFIGIQLYCGNFFDTGSISISMNVLILIMVTAIVQELKLNKIIFYIMMVLILLIILYACFWAKGF